MRLNNRTPHLPLSRHEHQVKTNATEEPRAEAGGKAADPRTRSACQKFEGFLLGELLKTMRSENAQTPGIIPASRGERIFIRQQCETLGDMLGQVEPLGVRRLLSGTGQQHPPRNDSSLAVPERGSSK